LESVSKGFVKYKGQRITGRKHGKQLLNNIGYVPETRDEQALFPDFNTAQNITLKNLDKISSNYVLNKKEEILLSKCSYIN